MFQEIELQSNQAFHADIVTIAKQESIICVKVSNFVQLPLLMEISANTIVMLLTFATSKSIL